MMRFNRSVGLIKYFGGGGKSDLLKVEDRKDRKQLRDKLILQFASEDDKSVFYEQSRVRRPTALYNLMTYLPSGLINQFNKLFADEKVNIRSDNLYLPRISKNGVPIYDSIHACKTVIMIRNFEAALPLLSFLTMNNPGPMLIAGFFAYFGLYRPVVSKLCSSFVLKMELCPETEEILFQKVGPFGFIKTSRVKTDDIEYHDRKNLSLDFYKVTRPFVDNNLIFKVKSTGQLLVFDPDGIWYEQGLNHQLMI